MLDKKHVGTNHVCNHISGEVSDSKVLLYGYCISGHPPAKWKAAWGICTPRFANQRSLGGVSVLIRKWEKSINSQSISVLSYGSYAWFCP